MHSRTAAPDRRKLIPEGTSKQRDLAINSQLSCANTVLAGQLIPSPLGS